MSTMQAAASMGISDGPPVIAFVANVRAMFAEQPRVLLRFRDIYFRTASSISYKDTVFQIRVVIQDHPNLLEACRVWMHEVDQRPDDEATYCYKAALQHIALKGMRQVYPDFFPAPKRPIDEFLTMRCLESCPPPSEAAMKLILEMYNGGEVTAAFVVARAKAWVGEYCELVSLLDGFFTAAALDGQFPLEVHIADPSPLTILRSHDQQNDRPSDARENSQLPARLGPNCDHINLRPNGRTAVTTPTAPPTARQISTRSHVPKSSPPRGSAIRQSSVQGTLPITAAPSDRDGPIMGPDQKPSTTQGGPGSRTRVHFSDSTAPAPEDRQVPTRIVRPGTPAPSGLARVESGLQRMYTSFPPYSDHQPPAESSKPRSTAELDSNAGLVNKRRRCEELGSDGYEEARDAAPDDEWVTVKNKNNSLSFDKCVMVEKDDDSVYEKSTCIQDEGLEGDVEANQPSNCTVM